MFRRLPLALIAASVLAAVSLQGCAEEAGSRLIPVNGHALEVRTLGAGRPALVMISGLGDGMDTFASVARDLSSHGSVIIYDRPGYGGSENTATAHDADAAVSDLDALLTRSGVAGPYILLGHSLGGLYAEAYASRYPEKVAGLILEESRPATFTDQCEAQHLSMCKPPALMGITMGPGARAELASLDAVMTQVQSMKPIAGKPVLVLSRPTGGKPMDQLWAKGQADLAARYPGSRHLTAPGGGHHIHTDQKAWFEKAVTEFLSQTGRSDPL